MVPSGRGGRRKGRFKAEGATGGRDRRWFQAEEATEERECSKRKGRPEEEIDAGSNQMLAFTPNTVNGMSQGEVVSRTCCHSVVVRASADAIRTVRSLLMLGAIALT